MYELSTYTVGVMDAINFSGKPHDQFTAKTIARELLKVFNGLASTWAYRDLETPHNHYVLDKANLYSLATIAPSSTTTSIRETLLHRELVLQQRRAHTPTTLLGGNWGCGVFAGNHALKLYIQLIASITADCHLRYHPINDPNTDGIHEFVLRAYLYQYTVHDLITTMTLPLPKVYLDEKNKFQQHTSLTIMFEACTNRWGSIMLDHKTDYDPTLEFTEDDELSYSVDAVHNTYADLLNDREIMNIGVSPRVYDRTNITAYCRAAEKFSIFSTPIAAKTFIVSNDQQVGYYTPQKLYYLYLESILEHNPDYLVIFRNMVKQNMGVKKVHSLASFKYDPITQRVIDPRQEIVNNDDKTNTIINFDILLHFPPSSSIIPLILLTQAYLISKDYIASIEAHLANIEKRKTQATNELQSSFQKLSVIQNQLAAAEEKVRNGTQIPHFPPKTLQDYLLPHDLSDPIKKHSFFTTMVALIRTYLKDQFAPLLKNARAISACHTRMDKYHMEQEQKMKEIADLKERCNSCKENLPIYEEKLVFLKSTLDEHKKKLEKVFTDINVREKAALQQLRQDNDDLEKVTGTKRKSLASGTTDPPETTNIIKRQKEINCDDDDFFANDDGDDDLDNTATTSFTSNMMNIGTKIVNKGLGLLTNAKSYFPSHNPTIPLTKEDQVKRHFENERAQQRNEWLQAKTKQEPEIAKITQHIEKMKRYIADNAPKIAAAEQKPEGPLEEDRIMDEMAVLIIERDALLSPEAEAHYQQCLHNLVLTYSPYFTKSAPHLTTMEQRIDEVSTKIKFPKHLPRHQEGAGQDDVAKALFLMEKTFSNQLDYFTQLALSGADEAKRANDHVNELHAKEKNQIAAIEESRESDGIYIEDRALYEKIRSSLEAIKILYHLTVQNLVMGTGGNLHYHQLTETPPIQTHNANNFIHLLRVGPAEISSGAVIEDNQLPYIDSFLSMLIQYQFIDLTYFTHLDRLCLTSFISDPSLLMRIGQSKRAKFLNNRQSPPDPFDLRTMAQVYLPIKDQVQARLEGDVSSSFVLNAFAHASSAQWHHDAGSDNATPISFNFDKMRSVIAIIEKKTSHWQSIYQSMRSSTSKLLYYVIHKCLRYQNLTSISPLQHYTTYKIEFFAPLSKIDQFSQRTTLTLDDSDEEDLFSDTLPQVQHQTIQMVTSDDEISGNECADDQIS